MHHHHHSTAKNLSITLLLNLFITITEFVGGIFAKSNALISDALHNFSDVLAIVISLIANKLAQRRPSFKFTYGLKRAEILAAIINSLTLIILSIFIVFSAFKNFLNHTKTNATIIIWLALLSILINGLSIIFLKKDAKENLNIKSAYLHLLGDMLTSIAVFFGGILIKWLNIFWIDSLLSVIIAIYIFITSWNILISSIKIIMQFTPQNLDIQQISQQINQIPNVENIHHIHIWQLDDKQIMLEAHIDLKQDLKISEFNKIIDQIRSILHKYNIYHFTLMPEYKITDSKDLIYNNKDH